MRRFDFGCLLALSFMTLTVSGCGGGGGGLPDGVTSGSVSGTVTSGGKPLPTGCVVNFYSEGGTGLPAGASLAEDGSFRLRLKQSFDVPTGIYKVVVLPPPPPEMTDEEAMEASVAGTLQTNDLKEIPGKYRSVETTTEEFEVKEGSNDAKIDLKA